MRAQADLARIALFYGPLDDDFAQRSLREALKAGEFLCEFPQAGPTTRRRGLRKWSVKNTPFLLLYRIVDGEVRITRVAHGAQDWGRW
ncbi:MAG: hypothetical protein JWN21_1422 [Sphingomonas bacterium]|uniref:type II toxin-antitoxin system RelE/ParE family toxin n=1 Tax=Sphingomonas bacterium TaxID=1895847 RepID=UPI00262F9190|nr:type II toxin-antitoxin system RelE/ParE family toxin [Sphingomonas bacterium]MDB5695879.1 hypothetical protein [Sphingomonas bacterium]